MKEGESMHDIKMPTHEGGGHYTVGERHREHERGVWGFEASTRGLSGKEVTGCLESRKQKGTVLLTASM